MIWSLISVCSGSSAAGSLEKITIKLTYWGEIEVEVISAFSKAIGAFLKKMNILVLVDESYVYYKNFIL